jgi:hypothetical protein
LNNSNFNGTTAPARTVAGTVILQWRSFFMTAGDAEENATFEKNKNIRQRKHRAAQAKENICMSGARLFFQ